MKITKDELLIRLAKLMFYVDPGNSVAGDLDFLHRLKVEFGEVKAIYDSLWKDELEIEGYVRADNFDDAEEMLWTLYIPDKPHTHPESGEFVLTCMKGDMEVVEFRAGAGFYFYNEDFGRYRVDDPYFPLFWRHLPNPPKELKNSSSCLPLPKPPRKDVINETK